MVLWYMQVRVVSGTEASPEATLVLWSFELQLQTFHLK